MLRTARNRLANLLKAHGLAVVFAESCTAGFCSGTLAQVNGMSPHLCGSVATYMPELKQLWLGVRAETIEQHTCESQPVANEMAMGVLSRVPQAQWGASVVGHLAADSEWAVWVAITRRSEAGEVLLCSEVHRPLQAESRELRQQEAVCVVFNALSEAIEAAER